jgi:superfamily II DNA or RNA helicase
MPPKPNNKPPSQATFPEHSWIHICKPNTLAAARRLVEQGAVRDVTWRPRTTRICCIVLPPDAPVVATEITFDRNNPSEPWSLGPYGCSCGHNGMCPHIAAVLLTLSNNPADTTPAPTPAATPHAGTRLPQPWESWFRDLNRTTPPAPAKTPRRPTKPSLHFVIHTDRPPGSTNTNPWIQFYRVVPGRAGTGFEADQVQALRWVRTRPPSFVTQEDSLLLSRLARLPVIRSPHPFLIPSLDGPLAIDILRALLTTERCHLNSPLTPALRLGNPRRATPAWRQDPSGLLATTVDIDPPAQVILRLSSPWFIDTESSECAPLTHDGAPHVLAAWLNAPHLDPVTLADGDSSLLSRFAAANLPTPSPIPIDRLPHSPPIPTLSLRTEVIPWWEAPWNIRTGAGQNLEFLAATLTFRYGEHTVDSHTTGDEIREALPDRIRIIPRDPTAEAALLTRINNAGLFPTPEVFPSYHNDRLTNTWTLAQTDEPSLAHFLTHTVPALESEGWKVVIEPGFHFELVQPSAWYLDVDPSQESSGIPWFEVELGIQVGEERINLLPILLEGLQQYLDLALKPASSPDTTNNTVFIRLPDNRRIPFPTDRLREILSTLVELHSPQSLGPDRKLRVHRLRAAQLGQLADGSDWLWNGGPDLRDLARRLREHSPSQPIPTPAGLQATLRPYQTDGLTWLQFLREFNLGGVLADDMGLGKTIQTLAHLQLEKESGRLDRPALVVSPTSVLVNWRDEIARFTPNLRVLTLHGTDRHSRFADLQSSDVVLTTYALLPRDAAELAKTDFHCVILDEAQNIKNPRTQAAQVVSQLRTRHRICLSGTPVENHLGELWSLFNFLIPGFLGDESRFRTTFRNPIEKDNDANRRSHLARRVRPFLLRRRKDQVARELPGKTEMVQKIELAGRQRDLYETIRLTMERRVREEIATKGVKRSHIIILDALLKLRQVCCDPSLVPIEAARKVTESAKLDHLMDLLPTLLEDGRRILLFSQFTSLLDIVQQRLQSAGIPWVILTGDTTDRATPVAQFQAGKVPLFLLSLKAGGSGLNLTAADTVILYDPWWNPAVEAQAIDRAHRIGQTKPVFVYRLIAAGTVEEKMAQLQLRKHELVQALLEEGTRGSLQLQPDDIDLLFSPLP